MNITVSDEQKDRAYRIYSTLFLAFEHLGYTVEIKAPKDKYYRNYEAVRNNETHVCLGKDSVSIFIKEKQKRIEHVPTKNELKNKYAYIPQYDFINTGKLHFGIDLYHAKRKNWRDSISRKIEDQIGEIIIWVIEAIHIARTDRERREAEKIRWEEQERIRQQMAMKRKNELEQLEFLEQHASSWDKAQSIRRFADNVEKKFTEIENEEVIEKLKNWLRWAREKADWLDPFVEKDDVVLGKGFQIFNLIEEFNQKGD